MTDTDRLDRAVAAITGKLAPYMDADQADERARNIVRALADYAGDSMTADINRMLEPIDEYRPGIEFARPRYRVAVECFRAWIETRSALSLRRPGRL